MNRTKRFVLLHNKRHPNEMGAREVEAFLTHLAVKEKVAASTQSQAFGALLFLYREVLKKDLGDSIHAIRARPAKHLPNVLTKDDAEKKYSRAAELFHQVGDKGFEADTYRVLSQMQLQRGCWLEALATYDRALAAKGGSGALRGFLQIPLRLLGMR